MGVGYDDLNLVDCITLNKVSKAMKNSVCGMAGKEKVNHSNFALQSSSIKI